VFSTLFLFVVCACQENQALVVILNINYKGKGAQKPLLGNLRV
jgi:hypothetical protein